MSRLPRAQAFRASPAQKAGGFVPKTFQGLNSGNLDGRYIFCSFARETDFKKKYSVDTVGKDHLKMAIKVQYGKFPNSNCKHSIKVKKFRGNFFYSIFQQTNANNFLP